MRRRSRQILSLFGISLVLGWLFPAGSLYADQTSPESGAEQGVLQERTGVAHLYFISPKGYHLAAEDRRMEADQAPALYAKALIQALLDGPRGEGLRCIPEDTRLLAVYVRNGLCYVDFSREISQGLPGGAEAEYMTVFALVNTLCLNVQDISSVKILIEGKEAETLGGHVELTYPYGADMTIIR